MEGLETAPPELSPLQRRILWVTAIAVAVTRFWARSRTLWDWDEVQFCLGLRDYDVAAYQPHPPGFPLYIALGKLVRLIAPSDFLALQTVSVVGAMALFPLVFLLAREMRFRFETAWGGALLMAFLPNVWLFGGTAFSDVPTLAVNVAACVLLLRGCRSRRAYFAGAVVLGLAAAMRPQALLIGCCAALVASWCRRRRWADVLIATGIGAAVVALSYLGAALASSSVASYLQTGASLRQYLRQVDSFLNPERPSLVRLLWTYFVAPMPGGRLSVALSLGALTGALLGLVRHRSSTLLLLATFFPFNVFAWLMLDMFSISRYATTFAPMYALLAAQAVVIIAGGLPRIGRFVAAIALVGAAVRYAVWSVPAIEEVKRSVAPPVSASLWDAAHGLRGGRFWVHRGMAPWAEYYLPPGQPVLVDEPTDIPTAAFKDGGFALREGPSGAARAQVFIRPRGRVFDVVRQRYFESSVIPIQEWVKFGDGWYGDEFDGETWWQWMGKESTLMLPPASGPARLSLEFGVMTEKGFPRIELWLNGALVDRFVPASGDVSRSWIVSPSADRWNQLVIKVDRTVNLSREGAGSDPRDLALQLRRYSWSPVGK